MGAAARLPASLSAGATTTATRGLLALWPLAFGVLILAVLWLGPLPAMSRRAFSPHMMLHLGVAVVAAPIIAIGLNRTRFGLVGVQPSPTAALAASAVEMLVVWGWHAPALHEAAALNDAAFRRPAAQLPRRRGRDLAG